MPQLNPAPWFFIFLLTWVVILTFSPKKISMIYLPNYPDSKPCNDHNKTWYWPWP